MRSIAWDARRTLQQLQECPKFWDAEPAYYELLVAKNARVAALSPESYLHVHDTVVLHSSGKMTKQFDSALSTKTGRTEQYVSSAKEKKRDGLDIL